MFDHGKAGPRVLNSLRRRRAPCRAAEIADAIGMSRQLVHYWLRAFERAGVAQRDGRVGWVANGGRSR